MSYYIWDGAYTFNPSIQTNFVLDIFSNLYLYMYNDGLYTCTYDSNNNPIFQATTQYAAKFVPSGTQFTLDQSYTQDQINAVINEILTGTSS